MANRVSKRVSKYFSLIYDFFCLISHSLFLNIDFWKALHSSSGVKHCCIAAKPLSCERVNEVTAVEDHSLSVCMKKCKTSQLWADCQWLSPTRHVFTGKLHAKQAMVWLFES